MTYYVNYILFSRILIRGLVANPVKTTAIQLIKNMAAVYFVDIINSRASCHLRPDMNDLDVTQEAITKVTTSQLSAPQRTRPV